MSKWRKFEHYWIYDDVKNLSILKYLIMLCGYVFKRELSFRNIY